jgi:tetratricopeptide (TPR) repeat protein
MATAAPPKATIEDKLVSAAEFKDAGNTLYKAGDFKGAASKYHKAILYMKGIDNDLHGTPAFLQSASVDPNHKKHIDAALEKRCIELNISVYNNLCMCLLQKKDSKADRIKELAEVVLELDKNNEKAWFRHGQACVRLNDFEKAKESFAKVAELSEGKNKEVPRWIQKCDLELKKRRDKELTMYKEMFGNDFKPEAWE